MRRIALLVLLCGLPGCRTLEIKQVTFTVGVNVNAGGPPGHH